jgi:hypothetical protein
VTVKTVKAIEVFQRFFPLAAAQLESLCIPHYPPYERGRTSGTQGTKTAFYDQISFEIYILKQQINYVSIRSTVVIHKIFIKSLLTNISLTS